MLTKQKPYRIKARLIFMKSATAKLGGRETCSYCVKFKEEISKAQLFNDFDVYYLDIDTILSEDLQKLYASDTYFNENEDWGTPLNFLYVDGKRVGELPGYVSSTELISFLTEHNVLGEK